MSRNIDEAIAYAKEKAEELERQYDFYDHWDEDENIRAEECLECARDYKQQAEWLTELKQRREADEWVPVSEGLPEKEGKCLVTTDFGDVCEDSFVDGIFVLYLGNVIAWRYKPAPYKENKDDNKS